MSPISAVAGDHRSRPGSLGRGRGRGQWKSPAEESLRAITGSAERTFQIRAEQLLGRLRSEFEFTRASDIIKSGLHEFIDRFQLSLNEVDGAIFDHFFATQSMVQSQSQAQ